MRRLETGSLVAALGATLLLVSLFLSWFDPGISAWDAFEVWDLVLAGLAIAVLAAVGAQTGWWRGPAPAVKLAVLGGATLLIVAAALVNHPPAAAGHGLDDGAWLGLVGAALIVAGGLMDGVGVSLSVEPRPARRRPAGPGAGEASAPVRDPAARRNVPAASPSPDPSRSRPGAPPVAETRRPVRGLFQRGRAEPGEDRTTELPPRRPADKSPDP